MIVEAAKDGSFREDLLFRLNVITIHLPPLRERAGDVERLVRGLLPASPRRSDARPGSRTRPSLLSRPGAGRATSGSSRTSSEGAVALSDGVIDVMDLSPRIAEAGRRD